MAQLLTRYCPHLSFAFYVGPTLSNKDLDNIEFVFSNVLKTGSDRPVRPVGPSTGHKTGPVQCKKPFLIELAVEPVNRQSNR